MSAEQTVNGASVLAEEVRGQVAVASGCFECGDAHVARSLFEGFVQVADGVPGIHRRNGIKVWRKVCAQDFLCLAHRNSALYDVVQLADVARPGMGLECAERVVEMDSAPAFDAK